MKINRENYEPYFIDLLDGTLSAEMVDELLDFLRLNPDLSKELEGIETIQLQPDKQIVFDPSQLMKTELDQPEVFNETCIHSIEKNLTTKEEEEFQSYLNKNSSAQKTYNLFKATISEPDTAVVYPNKSSLKHTIKIKPYWYAAAAVLLLAGLFWFNSAEPEISMPMAQTMPALKAQVLEKIEVEVPESKFASIQPKDRPKALPSVQTQKNEVLRTMPALPVASIESHADYQLALAPSNVRRNQTIEEPYPTVPELLAHTANKIDAKSEAKKLGYFALDKLKDLTDDKLSYATNKNGTVRKIEFNSRILAFSVPLNEKRNE